MNINLPRILSFVIIAIVIAALNVYSNTGPIKRMARARLRTPRPALQGAARRGLRTPFFHDLEFTEGGKPVTVRCKRVVVSSATTPAPCASRRGRPPAGNATYSACQRAAASAA